ncbi:MAG: hypothetical protein CHACPFDD_03556 [Phycisphaerae bacterium]|nr:hypothetical protein [Phycisphaerae bacterium]
MSMKLSDTTLKPSVDRWVASDGLGVVIWADRQQLVLLTHDAGVWRVKTHRAIEKSAGAAIHWRGVRYAQEGCDFTSFDEHASEAEWELIYDRSWGQAPKISVA